MIKTVFKGTLLSILVFFSVSFITFLTGTSAKQAGNLQNLQSLSVGFPLTYYQQNWLVEERSGTLQVYENWKPKNLLLSCFLYWVVVGGGYTGYTYWQTQQRRDRQKKRRRRRSSSINSDVEKVSSVA